MSSVLLYLAIVVMWLCVLVPMWLRRDRVTFVEFHDSVEPPVQDGQTVERDPIEAEPGAESPPLSPPVSVSVPASMSMSMPVAGPTAASAFTSTTSSMSTSSSASAASSVSPSGSVPVPPPAHSPDDSTVSAHPSSSSPDPERGSRGPRADRRRAERRRRAARVAKRRRLTLWCVLLILASAVTAAVQLIPWWGVAPSVLLLGFHLAVLRVSARIDAERRRAAARARVERVRRARRRAELEALRPVAEIIDLAAHRDELFDQYAEAARRAVGD